MEWDDNGSEIGGNGMRYKHMSALMFQGPLIYLADRRVRYHVIPIFLEPLRSHVTLVWWRGPRCVSPTLLLLYVAQDRQIATS